MPELTPEEARGVQAREWAMLAVDEAAKATTGAAKSRFWSVLAMLACLVALVLALAGCSDPGDPDVSVNARNCLAAGHKVNEHSQFGGKYSKTTYWCTDSDGQILDIWFEDFYVSDGAS